MVLQLQVHQPSSAPILDLMPLSASSPPPWHLVGGAQHLVEGSGRSGSGSGRGGGHGRARARAIRVHGVVPVFHACTQQEIVTLLARRRLASGADGHDILQILPCSPLLCVGNPCRPHVPSTK